MKYTGLLKISLLAYSLTIGDLALSQNTISGSSNGTYTNERPRVSPPKPPVTNELPRAIAPRPPVTNELPRVAPPRPPISNLFAPLESENNELVCPMRARVCEDGSNATYVSGTCNLHCPEDVTNANLEESHDDYKERSISNSDSGVTSFAPASATR